jgi:hypothetical protein
MILRRVIKHFRNQEWTAIFLDFIIVVVGVFVGLQVANWNEARAQKAQERGFLIQLREEVREIDRIREDQARFTNRIIEGGRRSPFLTVAKIASRIVKHCSLISSMPPKPGATAFRWTSTAKSTVWDSPRMRRRGPPFRISTRASKPGVL